MVRLLFFGRLGDLAGGEERSLSLSEPMAVAAIIDLVGETDRLLAAALTEPRVRCAVNGALVTADAMVGEGDELAFLPPVSGG